MTEARGMRTGDHCVAFVTMIRDDQFFLRHWIDHYARHVPRAHLFILLDGFDQTLPAFATGCQVVTLPRTAPGPGWDTRRWEMLANFAATLLGRFDVVVLNDVDEIILPDPAAGIGLIDALGRAREVGVITPFAVEVVHRHDLCPEPITEDRPILRQRPHVRVNDAYAKPCITAVPLRWNLGGHRSDFPTLNLDEVLYLFHLRFVDRDLLLARQASRNAVMQAAVRDQPVVAGSGWTKSEAEIERFLLALQEHGDPVDNDFEFGSKRRRMSAGWRQDPASGLWQMGRTYDRNRTYVVPERFRDLI